MPEPRPEHAALPTPLGILGFDFVGFTDLAAVHHAPVSALIEQIVQRTLVTAGLGELWDTKRFPANTGDGIVFGFDTRSLPSVLSPYLDVLEQDLVRHNTTSPGPHVRLRVAIHLGPLPDSGAPGDGNGTARNDTHRLLDSTPVKQALEEADPDATHVAAIISQRVFEDVVLGGYTDLHPARCVKVEATVPGKRFAQPAWVYVPRPSGGLLRLGPAPAGPPRILRSRPLPLSSDNFDYALSLKHLAQACEEAADALCLLAPGRGAGA
ncbi:hypothetical protein ACGFX2_30035 [Streptomyces goshikiensis]|uniref:hypothetical protein n=1 Tax=Streptomyces goshikiensis TaxID=1942 RepID=UPI003717D47E